MPSDFDPFGWDDDISFDPDELGKPMEAGADIDDINDLWELSLDYDYGDFVTQEFEGTGDTG